MNAPFDLLDPPHVLATLDSVPERLRSLYELTDGIYELHPEAKQVLVAIQVDRQGLIAKHEGEIVKLGERAERMASELDGVAIENEVLSLILSLGAHGPTARGCAAHFRSAHVIVRKDGTSWVESDRGDIPLREALTSFLSSPAGAVFMPKPKQRQDGSFSSQLKGR